MWRAALAGCILAVPVAARAQSSHGTEARTTRSGVFTTQQASRGSEIYALNCVSCHTAATHAGPAFAAKWDGRPLAELYRFMTQEMPKQDPGILSPKEYTLVLAYMLRMNGMPAGPDELPEDPALLERIRIDLRPARDSSPR
jgi:mono/diheme cytochrome c family protein